VDVLRARRPDLGPNLQLFTRVDVRHGPITIYDVAAAADVSAASVSRVLIGSRPVKQDTPRRVSEGAKQLSYQINPLASTLRGKVTRTVGMLVPDLVNPFLPGGSQGRRGRALWFRAEPVPVRGR
jgi:hypothetical protein